MFAGDKRRSAKVQKDQDILVIIQAGLGRAQNLGLTKEQDIAMEIKGLMDQVFVVSRKKGAWKL